MDRETEKRLDRFEAKLDKLTKLVEASADPRLVASTQGKETLKQATSANAGGERNSEPLSRIPQGKTAGGRVSSSTSGGGAM